MTLQFSKTLALALICGYLLPIGALAAASMPFGSTNELDAALLCGAGFAIREHVFHAGGAVRQIVLAADGKWLVRSGRVIRALPASLRPRALVLPWLTVLRFESPAAQCRTAILTIDNVDPDAFRRLRVRLRCSTQTPSQPPRNPQFT